MATLIQGITDFVDSIRGRVPGACVAAVDTVAKTSDTYAIGFADLDALTPFDADTIISIDSVTKLFTTIILAQAVTGKLGRDGPITLDATIDSYLQPYFPSGQTVPAAIAGITLTELANYTSGFPEHPSNESDPSAYTITELVDWLSSLTSGDLMTTPGKAYYYSDIAVGLLGFILADQLVQSSRGNPVYADLVDQQLLNPNVLNLEDTEMRPTPAQQSRVATGYLYSHSPAGQDHPRFSAAKRVTNPPPFLGGGGGLRTTALDMAVFLNALLDPPDVASLKTAIPLIAEVSFQGPTTTGGTATTGLGWDPIVQSGDLQLLLKNGGGSDGFYALVGAAPATGRALFFATNVAALKADLGVSKAFQDLLAQQSATS